MAAPKIWRKDETKQKCQSKFFKREYKSQTGKILLEIIRRNANFKLNLMNYLVVRQAQPNLGFQP